VVRPFGEAFKAEEPGTADLVEGRLALLLGASGAKPELAGRPVPVNAPSLHCFDGPYVAGRHLRRIHTETVYIARYIGQG
jgi:hypothetical protein